MNTKDIKKDEEINVESIMTSIRDNIRKKKTDTNKKEERLESENSVQNAIQYINSNSDIQNTSYHISSHRPIIGTLLTKGRELIHGETSRYVNPMVWKQKEFNANVLIVLNDIVRRLNDVILKSDKAMRDVRVDINIDIVEFSSEKRYDLIASISTLEHVGWDEEKKDSQKIICAIQKLRNHLKPYGILVATLPLGYNINMDRLFSENNIQFDERYYLKRVSEDNIWKQVDWNCVKDSKYGAPFPYANGLVIGIAHKEILKIR